MHLSSGQWFTAAVPCMQQMAVKNGSKLNVTYA